MDRPIHVTLEPSQADLIIHLIDCRLTCVGAHLLSPQSNEDLHQAVELTKLREAIEKQKNKPSA